MPPVPAPPPPPRFLHLCSNTGVSINTPFLLQTAKACANNTIFSNVQEGTQEYVKQKVEIWTHCVKKLIKAAESQPHAAHAALTKPLHGARSEKVRYPEFHDILAM